MSDQNMKSTKDRGLREVLMILNAGTLTQLFSSSYFPDSRDLENVLSDILQNLRL